ncbi:LacI family DNA-binding transcriptional regulator [Fodinibius sp.]|uniref:LacI family DNA-binding transcriptional regulator n=1 Tax=Fodinibius sp. TaxID=1872440 RepID=UPI002ACE9950|nr:LacI family DNA-binding transcriptional regulator [Fodinibius sp.]MDZ7660114.1 LacI family DNA-binding transcriptional regulator [Fodinibius sp.]
MSSEVTLKHIAEALGVSAMTVSRALNDRDNVDKETKKRIRNKAQSMGYTPNRVAKSLVSRKTHTIGVVIPEITHAFFPEVVRGIEEVAYKSDYQLFLTNANEQFEREKEAIETLRAQRVDGILVSSSLTREDYAFYESIIEGGAKVVFFDRCIEDIGASCVSVNDRESSQKITEHLILEHQYSKIAHLSGPQKVSIGRERLQGFLDAMNAQDIPINEDWIVQAGFREDTGYEAMWSLLQNNAGNLPQAVVAVNDPTAIGAIDAIRDFGLSIPEDIAIVGFTDDIRSPLLDPPLTTIHQSAYEIGEEAAKKLIQTIEEEDTEIEKIEVPTTLQIRSSCGCSYD